MCSGPNSPQIRLLPLLLVFFSAVSNSLAAQASDRKGQLIVTRRRIVLTRPAPVVKAFPNRKTAVVIYPVVRGLGDPAILKRVRSILSFKNIFDYSLDEYREDPWLTEFTYVVNYNRNGVFDITFTQSGAAAYPDTQTRHFAIDLGRGQVIKASDVFISEKLGSLAPLVDRKLQTELAQIIKRLQNDSELQASEAKSIAEAMGDMKFTIENINDFSIGAGGVTFLYDAGFPHAFRAFEPEGKYRFTYSELKPYINPAGLLGQFIR